MPDAALVTAEEVRAILAYSASSGIFRWKRGRNSGAVAGSTRPDGYVSIFLRGRRHYAHRLAWLHFHGQQPCGVIDHINGDPSDNAIWNLRDVSSGANQQSQRRAHRNNRSGVLGVHRSPSRVNPWLAQIHVGGRTGYLGCFPTIEEAAAAYRMAKLRFHNVADPLWLAAA